MPAKIIINNIINHAFSCLKYRKGFFWGSIRKEGDSVLVGKTVKARMENSEI